MPRPQPSSPGPASSVAAASAAAAGAGPVPPLLPRLICCCPLLGNLANPTLPPLLPPCSPAVPGWGCNSPPTPRLPHSTHPAHLTCCRRLRCCCRGSSQSSQGSVPAPLTPSLPRPAHLLPPPPLLLPGLESELTGICTGPPPPALLTCCCCRGSSQSFPSPPLPSPDPHPSRPPHLLPPPPLLLPGLESELAGIWARLDRFEDRCSSRSSKMLSSSEEESAAATRNKHKVSLSRQSWSGQKQQEFPLFFFFFLSFLFVFCFVCFFLGRGVLIFFTHFCPVISDAQWKVITFVLSSASEPRHLAFPLRFLFYLII